MVKCAFLGIVQIKKTKQNTCRDDYFLKNAIDRSGNVLSVWFTGWKFWLFLIFMCEYYAGRVHPRQTEALYRKFDECCKFLQNWMCCWHFSSWFYSRLTVFTHIVDLQFEKINLSVFLCAWVVCWPQFEWTAGNKYLIILLNDSSTALLFGFLSP